MRLLFYTVRIYFKSYLRFCQPNSGKGNGQNWVRTLAEALFLEPARRARQTTVFFDRTIIDGTVFLL